MDSVANIFIAIDDRRSHTVVPAPPVPREVVFDPNFGAQKTSSQRSGGPRPDRSPRCVGSHEGVCRDPEPNVRCAREASALCHCTCIAHSPTWLVSGAPAETWASTECGMFAA